MKKITLLVFVILNILLKNFVYGSEAYPEKIKFQQPDGQYIHIFLKGDEFVKWAITEDGYTLLYNQDGFLEYAIHDNNGDLTTSGIKATEISERSFQTTMFLQNIPKELNFSLSQVNIINQLRSMYKQEMNNSKSFPTTGNRKLVCILIGFTDRPFTKTQNDFNNLFNQIGYSSGGATGSVKDYYLENSYNQFNLTVDVAGPYTASENMAYYGQNTGGGGTDIRPRELIAEAIDLADTDVNYADYDNDGDDSVDGVYVIYAGYGEEAGGGTNCIWAHAWALSTPVEKDGVYLYRYSCSAELRGSSGTNLTHIGVICHEFGHVLGAPDYYDTDGPTGGSFSGTGQWDVMASGSWNNNGASPAHHNGFTKVVYYNWAGVNILTDGTTVTLNNASEYSNSFYKFNTSTPNEYFFVENRENQLFDNYIPGSGMLIYHVHSDVINAGINNNINVTHPQKMYLVAQNATGDPTSTPSSYGTINTASCAWTGETSTKNEFSDASLPSSKSWAANNTNKPLTNITRSALLKTVSFDFMGGSQGNPLSFTATTNSSFIINLSWMLNDNNDDVMVAYSTTNTFGTPNDGTTYTAGNSINGGGTVMYLGNGTSFSHSGLSPNTIYYYKAWSVMTGNTYTQGTTTYEQTPCISVTTFPFVQNFNTITSCPDCWSIVDNLGTFGLWQIGTFTPDPNYSLPFDADGNYAYLNSDGYGAGNSQNADLITPSFDFSGYSNINISFNHFYRHYTGSLASFYYSLDNGTNWVLLQQWSATSSNPASYNATLSVLDNQPQVKFKWNYTGTWGFHWCVDDVNVNADIENNLIVSNTTVNINSNMAYQDVTIDADGKLSIEEGHILTVTGNIIIDSDENGTGSFIDNGMLILQGNPELRRHLSYDPADLGWYVSPPLSNVDENILSNDADAVFYYDAPNAQWQNVPASSVLTPMTGYVTRYNNFGSTNGAKTISFTGSDMNTGAITHNNLIRTTNPVNYGWNLIGNPYPSPIDWDLVVGDNNLTFIINTHLNPAIYLRSHDGSVTTYLPNTGQNPLSIIPSMQAFWVQVNTDHSNASLSFNNSHRVHGANSLHKSKPANHLNLFIQKTGNTFRDATSIYFKQDAKDYFCEAFDAPKLFSINNSHPQIYSLDKDNEELAINGLPLASKVVPLGFYTSIEGHFSISAQGLNSFDNNFKIWLEDIYLNKTINLKEQNTYDFYSQIYSNTDRFLVHFILETNAMNEFNDEINSPIVYAYNNTLYVSDKDNNFKEINILNNLGQLVFENTLSKRELNVFNTRLSTGHYMVVLKNANKIKTHQIYFY